MAFGIEAFFAVAAVLTLPAQHDHLYKSGAGTLEVTEHGIVWNEPTEPKHSRAWSWENIQQLELEPGRMRLLTYDDAKWKAGRDREHIFRGVDAAQLHPLLREPLGAKYIAALPDGQPAAPVWRVPVKLQRRLGGSEGHLTFDGKQLVFESFERGESRSWPLEVVDGVSSADRYELTVYTLERAGWTRGRREFRFQLKTPIADQQYQALWRAVQRQSS